MKKSSVKIQIIIAISVIAMSLISLSYIKRKAVVTDFMNLSMNIINDPNSCFSYDVVDFKYPNARKISVYANAESIRVYVELMEADPESVIQTGAYFLIPNDNDSWNVTRFIRNQELGSSRYEIYEPYPIVDYDIARNLEMINLLNELNSNGHLESLIYGSSYTLNDQGLEYVYNRYNSTNVYFKVELQSTRISSATLKINYGEADEKVLSLTQGSGNCSKWPEEEYLTISDYSSTETRLWTTTSEITVTNADLHKRGKRVII